ncbi:MAG: hypothetical protein ABSG72_03410 [Candidatus Sulfotelmatobacter sp.]|jgi:hypothetical protein
MTNRVTYAPHDFQKMCKQAEREHESKKLVLLMERVKRQIAERENPSRDNPGLRAEASRLPVKSASGDSNMLRVVHPAGSV